ncbi:ABC transporter substrate-binding protein [Candidatus Latescibacterota bacterium]
MNKEFRSCIYMLLFLVVTANLLHAEQLSTITLSPMWRPQAQFAGYYVALEKGIYGKYGIEVIILRGGPEYVPFQYLYEKKADVGIMWLSSGLKERSNGAKIVNIAQFSQHSGFMFIAKKKTGIASPLDLHGKKISIWPGDLSIQPEIFLKKYNLSSNVIEQGYSVNLFVQDGVDVICGMSYNEYHMLYNFGFDTQDLTTFSFSEHGLDFPEDGLYVLEETLAVKHEALQRFVQASREGWKYAFDHPDEAVDIVLSYMRKYSIPANRIHQQRMLNTIKQLMTIDGAPGTGVLSPTIYEQIGRNLMQNNIINTIPEFSEFYHEMDY